MNQHPQAALFRALGKHLGRHPTLPRVNVLGGREWPELHISAYPHEGEINSSSAVLLWADTLDDSTVVLHTHGKPELHTVLVMVIGRIGAVTVAVWDVDDGDIHRLHDADQADNWGYSPISMIVLKHYVATGRVD